MKHVTIIIVNWNGWRDTVDCLDTVLAQDYKNFTVILVDNMSNDGSVGKIIEWCERPYRIQDSTDFQGVCRVSDELCPAPVPYRVHSRPMDVKGLDTAEVVILESGANLGFAGGCNAGAEFASSGECDYIWFLNSDTVVPRSALTELISRVSGCEADAMIGSTLLYYRRPEIVQAQGGADLDLLTCVIKHRGEGLEHSSIDDDFVERPLTYIVGASLLVQSSLIDTIGPMQEDYFLYYEEIDWAYRSRGRYRQLYAPRSLVYHKSGASSKDKVSEFSKRLLFRNKLIFFARYIPQLSWRLRYEMSKGLCRDILKGRWGLASVLAQVLGQESIRFKKSLWRPN